MGKWATCATIALTRQVRRRGNGIILYELMWMLVVVMPTAVSAYVMLKTFRMTFMANGKPRLHISRYPLAVLMKTCIYMYIFVYGNETMRGFESARTNVKTMVTAQK